MVIHLPTHPPGGVGGVWSAVHTTHTTQRSAALSCRWREPRLHSERRLAVNLAVGVTGESRVCRLPAVRVTRWELAEVKRAAVIAGVCLSDLVRLAVSAYTRESQHDHTRT